MKESECETRLSNCLSDYKDPTLYSNVMFIEHALSIWGFVESEASLPHGQTNNNSSYDLEHPNLKSCQLPASLSAATL